MGRQSSTPGTIAELLASRADRDPGRLAFRYLLDGESREATLSYGDLDRRAHQVAACLAARGARCGERALILLAPGLDYLAALFGCAYAGVVAVPAYPPSLNRTMLRLSAVVGDAGARLAIATSTTVHRLEARSTTEPALAGLAWITPEQIAGEDPAGGLAQLAPESLALLQYTSGSTGAPKGVMLSHRNLLENCAAIAERVRATADDRFVGWLPPYHDMGLIGSILTPAVVGVESTLFSPASFLQQPLRWLQAVTRHRGTITAGPNFAYELCARRAAGAHLGALDLSSLRVAISGAERVNASTLEAFSAAFASVGFRPEAFRPAYGLAEATLAVALGSPDEDPLVVPFDAGALTSGHAEPASPGQPSRSLVGNGAPAGCELAVVDPETRTRRGAGEVGEIWVRGPSVAGGYWGQAELTEQIFRARVAGEAANGPTYLRTGDLGFLGAGQVFVTGRLKDLIILLGVNYHPEDLEASLNRVHRRLRPGGAAAFSVDVDGEERLVLVHEVDRADELPAEEIAAAIRGAIADEHELAVHDVVLVGPGQVPKTSSGKVQRGACRAQYLAGQLRPLASVRVGEDRGAAADAPPAGLVERLQGLMAAVLSLDEVGPDDDFFALGGHSLLATQLLSRVQEALAVEVPLRVAFEAPTARALARRIATAASRAPPPELVRLDRSGPLPLSFSQERMWFLHQLDPGGSAYNVAGAVAIDGPLDTGLLERALRLVLDRHEILRSNYVTVDGIPRVVIAPSLALALPVVDLSARPAPEHDAERLAEELASTPFDLVRDALVRARLCRMGPDRHALAVCLHHIVADGWSMGVLVSEVFRAYEALAHSRPPPFAAQPLQYLDYAGWQRKHLGDATRRGLEYWRARLAGAPMLQLPVDHPPVGPSSKGAIEPLELPADLVVRLRALAHRQGATLFMVTLAALEVVLHRYTGQRSIVIGVPIANRNRLSAEPFVGTLVNTLPLRVEVDPDATFLELLRSVREASLEAHAHQDVPLEQLVSELRIQRTAGRTPLFPVMFDFLNVPMPVQAAGGLRLRPLTFSRRASQFDLSLSILDTELGQVGSLEYRTDLYEPATIRRLAGHYRAVLEAVVARSDLQVSRIPLLSAPEREAQAVRANAACTGRPAAVPVHRLFEAQAGRTPDAPAVTDASGTLSYRDLDRASNALARRLASMGAGPGQRVAVCLERSRAIAVALLAVLKARAAYVPLDPRHPAERVHYVLEDSEPLVLLTDRLGLARLTVPPRVSTICLDPAALALEDAAVEGPDADPASIAYVIYTSGSTGRPKGVEVPNGALSNFLASMRHTPGIAATDRLLSVTTVSFDIAGLELFLPLCYGACVEIAPADVVEDGRRLAERLERSGATLMQATPTTWRMLVEAGWRGDGRLKILVGGESLPRELADALLARAGAVWNMYGPTETTIWSTLHRVTAGEGPIPIGLPVDHTRLYVLDEWGELAPWGLPGEIFIGGAGVARGYFRRPELTAERFRPDPAEPGARMYRTGDAGRFRHDGALEYLGRLDHQIKIRGHRVEPGEIEAVLREHGQVKDAVVVAREDRPGDVRLVAYVVPRERQAGLPQQLRELLRRTLPAYMVPASLVALDALPLTPNGKIDRKALPVPEVAAPTLAAERVAPRTALEAEMLGLWTEVLGTPVRSVTDSFFDLGGHSLLVAQLLSRVEKRLGVALPFAALLDHPTIERLAEAVRERQVHAGEPVAAVRPLVELRGHGSMAPLFCVHGAGGNVLNLHDIARHLNGDRPFIGLQAPGTDGATASPATIEAMASSYLAEIRAQQPSGPIHLSGYCGGGIVAFEMARQLLAAGEAVKLVTLIDCPCPALAAPPWFILRWLRIVRSEGPAAVWFRFRTRLAAVLDVAVSELRIGHSRRRGAPIPYELRGYWLIKQFRQALRTYALRPAPFKLLVLRARDGKSRVPDADGALGWRLYAAAVEAHDLPGDHFSIAQEPNAGELAARIEASLREVEGRPAGGL